MKNAIIEEISEEKNDHRHRNITRKHDSGPAESTVSPSVPGMKESLSHCFQIKATKTPFTESPFSPSCHHRKNSHANTGNILFSLNGYCKKTFRGTVILPISDEVANSLY